MLTAQKTFGREVFEYKHTAYHLYLIILVNKNIIIIVLTPSHLIKILAIQKHRKYSLPTSTTFLKFQKIFKIYANWNMPSVFWMKLFREH